MSQDNLILWSLAAWFFMLAVVEAVQQRREDVNPRSGDGRLVTNFGLTAAILAVSALFPFARVTASLAGEHWRIGLCNVLPLPWLAVFAAMLLVDSFLAYWTHRLMHRVPLLWRVHRVHHADTALDVSTSLRNHPFELLVTVPASSLAVLLVGAPVSAVAASQTVILAAAIWQHADIRLPDRLEHVLAPIIITPRLHRLHHNPERRVHDTNFGDSIVLWDWLFGTLNVSEERKPVGLHGQRARADHLLEQIWSPLQPA